MTEKEEKEFEKLDKIRIDAMRHAERHCRKLKVGKYQWSPELQVPRDEILYIKLSLSRANGRYVGARNLIKLANQLNMSTEGMLIPDLEEALVKAYEKYKKIRQKHEVKRVSYLEELSSVLAKKNKCKKAAIVKQLTHIEQQRATF